MSSPVKCTAKRSKSESFIHSLPEGIMHDIVSRLTLKDAVKTSSVSTNWRRLWTCHPDLCFDSPTILNRDPGSRSRRRRHRFIRRVNAILESHDGTRLRRAPIISINLVPVFHKRSAMCWEETYTLPSRMFSSQDAPYIELLQLACVSLKPPNDFDGFANLRVLDLQYVYMPGGDIELLLSKCDALECLRLSYCCPMPNLKVQRPQCRLRYVSVRECRPQGMEFNAPNLAKFDYSGEAIPITLGESMKLTKATVTLVGYDDTLEHVFTELPKTLPHVEKLFVNTCINTQVFGFSKCLMKYTHLIKLEVTVRVLGDSRYRNGILRLASLLEVAPLLQRLELNMLPHVSTGFFNVPEAYWHSQPCIHRHLEQVEVSGFIGVQGQLELVFYILDNAAALRGMSIEPRMTAYDRVSGYRAGSDIDIRTGRECALKNFLPEDYPNVQIEIF